MSASGADPQAAGASQPLRGVRVVDLSMGWSGPLGTRHLADLGAEVIKIESIQRFDWWRTYERTPEALARIERSIPFIAMNRNKLGVTLDLTAPRGIELFHRLVARADAVIENNAASVLQGLGLAYEQLVEHNPELIMLSMPAYGASGPWRDHRAYGSTVEQAAGLPHLNGEPAAPPTMQHVAWGDAVAGLNAAAALLIALWHKRRTGRGQRIDLSQVECLFALGVHGIVEQTLNRRPWLRRGNRHAEQAPHGVYPCLGEDRWIAIAVADDAAWRALCRVLGRPDLEADAALASAPGRVAAGPRLDALVASWTRAHDPASAMVQLQSAGVPAGAVNRAGDLLEEPQLAARGFWQSVERRFVGLRPTPSAPYRLAPEPLPVRSPAPTLGEHNREVLIGLLGLTEAEFEQLEAERVIGTEPA